MESFKTKNGLFIKVCQYYLSDISNIFLDTFLDGYKQREDAASSGNAKRLCHIEIKRAELTKETSIKDGIYIIKIKPHDK